MKLDLTLPKYYIETLGKIIENSNTNSHKNTHKKKN
jgi:hypothetical protein